MRAWKVALPQAFFITEKEADLTPKAMQVMQEAAEANEGIKFFVASRETGQVSNKSWAPPVPFFAFMQFMPSWAWLCLACCTFRAKVHPFLSLNLNSFDFLQLIALCRSSLSTLASLNQQTRPSSSFTTTPSAPSISKPVSRSSTSQSSFESFKKARCLRMSSQKNPYWNRRAL